MSLTVVSQPPVGYRSYPQVAALKLQFTATSSGILLASGVKYVLGWSFNEPTNLAGADFTIWDNASGANGPYANYGQINLAQNESARDWFGPNGLFNESGGLYLAVASGSVNGTIFYT